MGWLLERLASKLQDSSSDEQTDHPTSRESGPELDTLISSKRREFVSLLEEHDGRMKQAEIVSLTEWSSATVSRELSEMEADGIVRKIPVGRSNMVALVGAEPNWYTPPDTPNDPREGTHDRTGDSEGSGAILLIEDDQQEAKLLKRAFKEANVANPIHTVRDGLDAVEFLLQRGTYADAPNPRLVLLDLGLMDVDGLEVLRELDNREALRQFPVIVLSHSDEPTDIRQSYQAGATGYLTKPNDLDELTELVNAIDAFWLSSKFQPPQPAATNTDDHRQRFST